MSYSKEEAIKLLGVRVLVVKPMVRKIPDEDFDIPILDLNHMGIIDMILLEPEGICLNLTIDGDLTTLTKDQFQEHCQILEPKAVA